MRDDHEPVRSHSSIRMKWGQRAEIWRLNLAVMQHFVMVKLTVGIVDNFLGLNCRHSNLVWPFMNIESCLLAPGELSDHVFNVIGDSWLAGKVL